MNQFPISKSFLLQDALARRVEKEYGLANVTCQLITTTLRDVYLVTSARGKFILYLYQHEHRSPSEISAEWKFVDYLYRSGLPVAPAIPNKSGECLLSFLAPEGVRFGVLTQFVEGVILRRRPGIAAVRALGRIVAGIHVTSDQMPFTLDRPALDFERMILESVAAFERQAPDRTGDLAYLRESVETLRPRLGKLPAEKPLYGMIHGDVIRANALVADDGRVTILDFDFCGFGWRIYDVVSCLLTIRNTPQEEEFEGAFLEGYEGIRPFAPEEKEAFPLFEAVRAIISIGIPAMNIEHWGSQYFEAFVDRDLAALRDSMNRIR